MCISATSSGNTVLVVVFPLCTVLLNAIASGMFGSISTWLREVRVRRLLRRRGEVMRRMVWFGRKVLAEEKRGGGRERLIVVGGQVRVRVRVRKVVGGEAVVMTNGRS
jgi:hypothetical protein